MIKRIVAIPGKPGLYSLVSHGKNMLVVENIQTKRRMPAYASDKVLSLGDIAIYTYDEDKPLYEVFDAISKLNDGKPVAADKIDTPEKAREYFGEVLPDFDRERVYNNDIKKVFAWYNLLVSNGIDKFKDDEIAQDQAAEASDPGTADAAATYEAEVK